MFQFTKVQLLLFGLIALILGGCLKTEQASIIPAIQFISFVRTNASDTAGAYLTISFKDGDGDIGRLDPSNTNPPYDSASPYRYDLNMIFYGLAKGDNQFRRYYNPAQNDSFRLGYILPLLPQAIGSNKTINGQIITHIPFPFYPIGLYPPVNFTACRFDIYIYDRALHKSNIVSTGPISLP